MRPLTGDALVGAWEAGERRPWPRRALALLAASAPGTAGDEWAALSIGERDRRLLQLRELTFGPAARASVTCPSCGERLEFELDMPALRSRAPTGSPGPLRVSAAGFDVTVRLPHSQDLLMASAQDDPE